MKRISLVILVLVALALVGCVRPASTQPANVAPGEVQATATMPFPAPETKATDTGSLPDAMNTLTAGGFATMTAQAVEQSGSGSTSGGDTGGSAGTGSVVQDTPTPEPQVVVPAAPEPTQAPPAPTQAPQPAPNCSSPYTVVKGDWVYQIGRRCNLHPDDIIAANGLRYPYLIYPGDVLTLPSNARPFPGQ